MELCSPDPSLCNLSRQNRITPDARSLHDLNEGVFSQFLKQSPTLYRAVAPVEDPGAEPEPLERVSNSTEISLAGRAETPVRDIWRQHYPDKCPRIVPECFAAPQDRCLREQSGNVRIKARKCNPRPFASKSTLLRNFHELAAKIAEIGRSDLRPTSGSEPHAIRQSVRMESCPPHRPAAQELVENALCGKLGYTWQQRDQLFLPWLSERQEGRSEDTRTIVEHRMHKVSVFSWPCLPQPRSSLRCERPMVGLSYYFVGARVGNETLAHLTHDVSHKCLKCLRILLLDFLDELCSVGVQIEPNCTMKVAPPVPG
ncbi:hypothetical protein ABIA25_002829 [Sinorhizobium fredii]|uniref:hypothetical protein n=1 Tax=Rhizobium fredii TaxID=380 RepID=UPI003514027C